MKNSILVLLLFGAVSIGLISCQPQSAPMSEEDMQSHIDSIFVSQKAEVEKTLMEECNSTLQANVEAKMKELNQ